MTLQGTFTVHCLHPQDRTRIFNRLHEAPVVNRFLLDLREEIRHNATKEFEIVQEELGHIDIPDGAQTDHLLIHIRMLTLQVS